MASAEKINSNHRAWHKSLTPREIKARDKAREEIKKLVGYNGYERE